MQTQKCKPWQLSKLVSSRSFQQGNTAPSTRPKAQTWPHFNRYVTSCHGQQHKSIFLENCVHAMNVVQSLAYLGGNGPWSRINGQIKNGPPLWSPQYVIACNEWRAYDLFRIYQENDSKRARAEKKYGDEKELTIVKDKEILRLLTRSSPYASFRLSRSYPFIWNIQKNL